MAIELLFERDGDLVERNGDVKTRCERGRINLMTSLIIRGHLLHDGPSFVRTSSAQRLPGSSRSPFGPIPDGICPVSLQNPPYCQNKSSPGRLGHGIGIGPARTLSCHGKYRSSPRTRLWLGQIKSYKRASVSDAPVSDRCPPTRNRADTHSQKHTATGCQGRALDGLSSTA